MQGAVGMNRKIGAQRNKFQQVAQGMGIGPSNGMMNKMGPVNKLGGAMSAARNKGQMGRMMGRSQYGDMRKPPSMMPQPPMAQQLPSFEQGGPLAGDGMSQYDPNAVIRAGAPEPPMINNALPMPNVDPYQQRMRQAMQSYGKGKNTGMMGIGPRFM
jgi:hypothetical protein